MYKAAHCLLFAYYIKSSLKNGVSLVKIASNNLKFNQQDIILIDPDSRSNQLATPVANTASVNNINASPAGYFRICYMIYPRKNNNLTTIEGRHGMMIKS